VYTRNKIDRTWKISNDHIRQIVSYIYLKLFGGTMCIMTIFMINSSNQWSQYFIFIVILNIHIWYRHPGVWYRQVNREDNVSDLFFSECFKETNAKIIEQNVRSSLFRICICVRVPKQWKWIRVKAWPGMSKLFRNVFRNTWKLFKKNSKSASFHSI
jgi:hypothetical protein